MKLLTSKIDKIEEFSDNSISFTMTVRISDQKLSNFNIQFALDITDDDNTQYFDTNSNFKIIKESKSYSEVQFTVTRFSIDPSINFDRLTNFSSFYLNAKEKMEIFLFIFLFSVHQNALTGLWMETKKKRRKKKPNHQYI